MYKIAQPATSVPHAPPEETRIPSRKSTLPAIYVPAAIVSAGEVAATILQRGEPGGAVALTTTLALVVILVYFLLAVVSLVRSYVRATPFRRASVGLNALAGCMVLGLAPMIPTAVYLVSPGVVFPGSDCYDVTWVLIPFALARATVLQAGREPERTAGT